jgi:hypothetical protein
VEGLTPQWSAIVNCLAEPLLGLTGVRVNVDRCESKQTQGCSKNGCLTIRNHNLKAWGG